MATNPKMKPCPHCGKTEHLDVYKYDSGWCYVECDNSKCTGNFYRGPGEGSVRAAIKSHNETAALRQFLSATNASNCAEESGREF